VTVRFDRWKAKRQTNPSHDIVDSVHWVRRCTLPIGSAAASARICLAARGDSRFARAVRSGGPVEHIYRIHVSVDEFTASFVAEKYMRNATPLNVRFRLGRLLFRRLATSAGERAGLASRNSSVSPCICTKCRVQTDVRLSRPPAVGPLATA